LVVCRFRRRVTLTAGRHVIRTSVGTPRSLVSSPQPTPSSAKATIKRETPGRAGPPTVRIRAAAEPLSSAGTQAHPSGPVEATRSGSIPRAHSARPISAPILTFAFQDRTGRGFQGQTGVRSSAYRPGDTVSVTYHPREPARVALTASLTSDRETRDLLIMALVGALMLVGAAIPTGRILARALTISEVMRQGRVVEGTVIAVNQRTTGVGRPRPRYPDLEYPGPTGQPLRSLSDDVPGARRSLATPGARVKVLVDRRNPGRTVADVWGWR
jgi:hypothetical protein